MKIPVVFRRLKVNYFVVLGAVFVIMVIGFSFLLLNYRTSSGKNFLGLLTDSKDDSVESTQSAQSQALQDAAKKEEVFSTTSSAAPFQPAAAPSNAPKEQKKKEPLIGDNVFGFDSKVSGSAGDTQLVFWGKDGFRTVNKLEIFFPGEWEFIKGETLDSNIICAQASFFQLIDGELSETKLSFLNQKDTDGHIARWNASFENLNTTEASFELVIDKSAFGYKMTIVRDKPVGPDSPSKFVLTLLSQSNLVYTAPKTGIYKLRSNLVYFEGNTLEAEKTMSIN